MTERPLDFLRGELAQLAALGQLRERKSGPGQPEVINLCSNDYLGYNASGRLAAALGETARRGVRVGAGASRLVCGDTEEHRALERELADWVGQEAALSFTSGYAANVGTVAALARAGDHVFSDALNHASLVDGCRLSRARITVVPHLDLDALRVGLSRASEARRWVVTESYFSMDGDCPDLRALRAICDEQGAILVVDEAHALGIFAGNGAGRAALEGVSADVLMGTFGKALATQGAFAAGPAILSQWLWNRARSFVFSTGLSPVITSCTRQALELLRADDAGRARVTVVAARLRSALSALGLAPGGVGPIIPVVLGTEARALGWSRGLAARGVLVQAIRPPTVPAGSSRLRITARADLTDEHVEAAIAAFRAVAEQLA